jgi:hypothetical protein
MRPKAAFHNRKQPKQLAATKVTENNRKLSICFSNAYDLETGWFSCLCLLFHAAELVFGA